MSTAHTQSAVTQSATPVESPDCGICFLCCLDLCASFTFRTSCSCMGTQAQRSTTSLRISCSFDWESSPIWLVRSCWSCSARFLSAVCRRGPESRDSGGDFRGCDAGAHVFCRRGMRSGRSHDCARRKLLVGIR